MPAGFPASLRSWTLCFNIRKYVAKHDNSFILTGWIPEEDEENSRSAFPKSTELVTLLRTPARRFGTRLPPAR